MTIKDIAVLLALSEAALKIAEMPCTRGWQNGRCLEACMPNPCPSCIARAAQETK